jgi:threonine/homoserine/homoserine lactone efflux protein
MIQSIISWWNSIFILYFLELFLGDILSRLAGMHRITELLVLLVLLFVGSLDMISQNVAITDALSSNTGKYQEELSLTIGEGISWVSFTFSNVSGLFDASSLEADPSFIMTMVLAQKINESYSLGISASFNESLVTFAEAKMKADAINHDLSSIFGTSIPLRINYTTAGLRTFGYVLDDYPAQNLENIFFLHIPSQGFAELITSGLNFTLFSFSLTPETMFPFEGPLMWRISTIVSYSDYLDISPGHEYQLSLKNLLNYPYSIKASPHSSASKIALSFIEDTEKLKFLFLETNPQMSKEEQTYQNIKMTTFTAELSPGSSIDDVSIHFKIVSPGYIDPTIIYLIIGLVVVIVTTLVVVGFTTRRKRRAREERKYIWSREGFGWANGRSITLEN